MATDRTPAELGKLDGARWVRMVKVATGLQAAHACGEWHMRRIEQGKVKASDVIEYGQAFVDAALAVLDGGAP
jgi:hypothetical protein